MNEQQNPCDKDTREVKFIMNQFKQLYEGSLTVEQIEEQFNSCFDEMFAKNKTSLTENEVCSLYDHFKVAANKHSFLLFRFNDVVTSINSCIVAHDLTNKMIDPLGRIKSSADLRPILPFGIMDFDFVNRRNQRTRTRQNVYMYWYKIHYTLPWQLQKPMKALGVQAAIFFNVISYKWIQAAAIFQQAIKTNELFKTKYFILVAVFENLANIQSKVKQEKKLRDIFEKRIQPEINSDIEDLHKEVNQIKHSLEFTCILCENFQMFLSIYIQATLYFLSLGRKESDNSFKEIVYNEKLPEIVKFYFARRFLKQQYYQQYLDVLQKNIKAQKSLEYIPFMDSASEIQQILQNEVENSHNIEIATLISLVLLSKKSRGFKKKSPIRELVETYLELIKFGDSEIAKINFTKFYQNISDFNGIDRQLTIFSRPIISMTCNSCGKNLIFGYQLKSKLQSLKNSEKKSQFAYERNEQNEANQRINQEASYKVHSYHCKHCKFLNSVCAICLEPVSMFRPQTYYNEIIKSHQNEKKKKCDGITELFDDSLVYCPQCEHGGHFKHVLQWQNINPQTCPVVTCKCKCKF